MITKEKIKEFAELAGFEYSHEGDDWMCFKLPPEMMSPYKILFSINEERDSMNYVETEIDVIARLFYESRRIGKIELRKEINDILSIFNTD